GILLFDRPERVPRADIRPARGERHHDRLQGPRLGGDALHHRIVDRIGRALGEAVRIDAQERAVALALPVGALARGENLAPEAADRLEPDGSAHREDAAIPQVAAARNVLARGGGIGLLDERLDIAHARLAESAPGADIAVARLGGARRHAEGDDVALP